MSKDVLKIQNYRIQQIVEILRQLEEAAYNLNYELQLSEYSKDFNGTSTISSREVKDVKKKVSKLFDGLTELIDSVNGT